MRTTRFSFIFPTALLLLTNFHQAEAKQFHWYVSGERVEVETSDTKAVVGLIAGQRIDSSLIPSFTYLMKNLIVVDLGTGGVSPDLAKKNPTKFTHLFPVLINPKNPDAENIVTGQLTLKLVPTASKADRDALLKKHDLVIANEAIYLTTKFAPNDEPLTLERFFDTIEKLQKEEVEGSKLVKWVEPEIIFKALR